MQKPVSQTDSLFNLIFSEDEKIGLTSQETLRRVVGVLGMLLPVLLWVFVFVDNGYAEPLDSISHYYFTRVASIFCVVVSLLAIFLMIYKGKEPMDFYLSFTAGIFAFFVILFPTDNITQLCCDADKSYSVTQLKISGFRTTFHYISAAVFLLCLAIFEDNKPVPTSIEWQQNLPAKNTVIKLLQTGEKLKWSLQNNKVVIKIPSAVINKKIPALAFSYQ